MPDSRIAALSDLIDLVGWLRAEALPMWADRGFDRQAGRFHERLDVAARPVAVPYRAMVQARQVYVYAHAARLGWFADGADLADRAMGNLVRDYAETSEGHTSFGFSRDPLACRMVSGTRDSYTHAFVLFALAHLHALTGDTALLDLADRTTRYVERAMVDPLHGGVIDDAARPGGPKRQNPQMHLLEAYLALHEVAPDGGYDERADRLIDLFHARLCSSEHGVLIEHFAADWTPHPEAEKRDRFEPGHHYEWIWLLRRHERLTQGADHHAWRERLHETARRHGTTKHGLLVDELLADRTVVRSSHRVWPHAEAIKAAAVRQADGDAGARDFADAMAGILLHHFLGRPFAGGWIDQLSGELEPLVDYVPASSLYHLMLAASQAEETWTLAAADCGARSPGRP